MITITETDIKINKSRAASRPIGEMLDKLTENAVMFAMPGHKGGYPRDITEIDGADNLLAPSGCIEASEREAALRNGASRAFYSTNGSTACVNAMISSLGRGAKVIAARDMHMSAVNALEMNGDRAVLVGTADAKTPPRADDICAAIDENGDAAAVFVTSPNYYGKVQDMAKIAQKCRERSMLLLVDGAHGAHLPFSPLLPPSPGEAGADIWCASYHKTLPALNQAAVLFCGKNADAERLKRCLARVHTTSPSYPIMESIEAAGDYMERCGEERLAALKKLTDGFLGALPRGIAADATDDFTRIVLDTGGRGVSGFEAEARLAAQKVFIEAADERRIILICSVADKEESFERLKSALESLPVAAPIGENAVYPLLGGTADYGSAEQGCFKKSVFAYPPGVPVLLKCTKICAEVYEEVAQMQNKGYNLLEW